MRDWELRKMEPKWEELGNRVLLFLSSVGLCASVSMSVHWGPSPGLPVTVLMRFHEIIKCTLCPARGLVHKRLLET